MQLQEEWRMTPNNEDNDANVDQVTATRINNDYGQHNDIAVYEGTTQ